MEISLYTANSFHQGLEVLLLLKTNNETRSNKLTIK